MADHAKFATLAKRLIEKHGREVSFKRLPADPSDPARPWRGSTQPDEVLATVKAAFIPHKGLEFGTDFIDEELLKRCTELCLAPADVDLSRAHVVHDEGRDFKINWVRRLKPADVAIVYALGVER